MNEAQRTLPTKILCCHRHSTSEDGGTDCGTRNLLTSIITLDIFQRLTENSFLTYEDVMFHIRSLSVPPIDSSVLNPIHRSELFTISFSEGDPCSRAMSFRNNRNIERSGAGDSCADHERKPQYDLFTIRATIRKFLIRHQSNPIQLQSDCNCNPVQKTAGYARIPNLTR